MKHLDGKFQSNDGLQLYFQSWRPDDAPKAVVQIIHGFGEHSGRYMNVVNALLPRGYVIYADDHRGHGLSEGIEMYVKKFDNYVEDQKIFFDLIKEKEPNLPHFILGHSMGSVIAALYVVKYPAGIQGLVLSGAATHNRTLKGIMKAFAKFLGTIAGKMRMNVDLADGLSHDPEVVQAYRDDPLVHKKTTIRLGAEFARGIDKARKFLGDITVPTLVQSGGDDPEMLGAEQFKDLLKVEDKTIKIYDGLFHEIYNETKAERKVVLKDLGDWLDDHL
ncbi:MAG: lysophospholipase [Candidatus Helarchaeota archaeon]